MDARCALDWYSTRAFAAERDGQRSWWCPIEWQLHLYAWSGHNVHLGRNCVSVGAVRAERPELHVRHEDRLHLRVQCDDLYWFLRAGQERPVRQRCAARKCHPIQVLDWWVPGLADIVQHPWVGSGHLPGRCPRKHSAPADYWEQRPALARVQLHVYLENERQLGRHLPQVLPHSV